MKNNPQKENPLDSASREKSHDVSTILMTLQNSSVKYMLRLRKSSSPETFHFLAH